MREHGFMGASPRKSRGRPITKATIALQNTLEEIISSQRPMTVRGAFYAASVAGAVEKTDAGYKKVGGVLVRMRERGQIPWTWITDGTRWRCGPRTYNSMEEALHNTAQLYRRDLWARADERVEVWLEKEALAGVVMPVTESHAVDLMVCRGYPSRSFLFSAAENAKAVAKPLIVYYLGDFDPSGRDIPRYIEKELRAFGADFELCQVAVLQEQIEQWQLPTRPTKKSDTRSSGFSETSVELDAIPPDTLRSLVDDAISAHVDDHEVAILRTFEDEERSKLLQLAGTAGWPR